MPELIATDHTLTAKLWAEGLEAECLRKISVSGFTGSGSDAVIQHRDNLERSPGDNIRVGLRMQEEGAPVTSGTDIEGSEKNLELKYMDVTLDEFAQAFKWENVMSRQRVTFEHRDEAKAAISDNLAHAWDTSFFNQIAGQASGVAPTFDGHNDINAPEAANHIFGGGAASEALLVAADILTLDLISEAKNIAKVGATPIRKARIKGFPVPLYVVFVHPWQSYLMRQQDSRWDNICNSAMQGGMIGDNPLITGAQGIWDECLIVENSRVVRSATDGAGGETIRRAVLCGAQAAMCCYGRIGGTAQRFRWVEKLFDFDRKMGIMGGFVGGIKKSFFAQADPLGGAGDIDYSTVVISTASAADDV